MNVTAKTAKGREVLLWSRKDLYSPHFTYFVNGRKDLCKYDLKSPGREIGKLERRLKENLMVVTDKAILPEF